MIVVAYWMVYLSKGGISVWGFTVKYINLEVYSCE